MSLLIASAYNPCRRRREKVRISSSLTLEMRLHERREKGVFTFATRQPCHLYSLPRVANPSLGNPALNPYLHPTSMRLAR